LRGAPRRIVSQIVAIGGGDLHSRETYDIDRHIVEAVERNRPWALCVSAASGDDKKVSEAFGDIYGDTLRCRTDFLRLIQGDANGDDFVRKIARSEIIYFADGDPSLLVHTLHRWGVVDCLKNAYRNGVVLCGVGAGAVCWAQSIFAADPLEGLGFLDFNMAVGNLGSTQDIQRAVDMTGHPCILLDDRTAIHIRGSHYRIIAPNKAHETRRLWPNGQSRPEDILPADSRFRPLADLVSTRFTSVAAG